MGRERLTENKRGVCLYMVLFGKEGDGERGERETYRE